MTTNRNQNKDDINLLSLIETVYRRKTLLIFPTVIAVAVALVITHFTTPIYQAEVVIKKERPLREKQTDDFRDIIFMQSSDEVETEMELIKSRTVLSKVVKDLNLNIKIEKLELPDEGKVSVNKDLYEYSSSLAGKKVKLYAYPNFPEVKINNPHKSGSYYLKKIDKHIFGLYDAITDSLLQTIRN